MDAVAHGKTVLSAVVAAGGSTRALDYAASRLGPEHFTDTVQQRLFLLLIRYADANEGIMTRAALGDLLRGKKPGTVQMFGEAYDALAAAAPERHEFLHSVAQLRDLAAERATGDAMAVAMRIMNPRPGEEVRDEHTGEPLVGHAEARAYVVAAFAVAERAGGAQDSPEGDVRAEGDDILAVYAAVKEQRKSGRVPGIEFGIPTLDDHLDGGIGNGELGLVAAAMTAGKSSLCVQCAWHNAVNQGKNVVIFTTEQHRNAVRIKLVARHSRHPKFGLPRGLDTRLIRSGRLGEEGERALAAVVDDLKNGGYGMLHVVQMPETCTLSVLTARAAAISRQVAPDLVIIDYLQLLDPERRTRDSRLNESQGGILKGTQRWAQSFLHGRGVPVISPWQVNKEGIGSMRSSGEYRLEDLSETIEAGRTPGMVLGLMAAGEDESHGRAVALTAKVLKYRDGPRGAKFPLTADFANSHFSDRDDVAAEDYPDLDL